MTSARILYIDDDQALTRLIQRRLGRRGYEVEAVATLDDGIARIARGDIDLVALDHNLPTGTGLDFLAELSSRTDPPPVVYVTGVADTAVAVAALKAGAADYVGKTTGEEFFELLASAIDQALEKARLMREHKRAEIEVRAAKERAEMMLDEVNHRVANSLALVASLVGMQSKGVADPAVRTALSETQNRISAIANIHRRLYTSQDVRSVEISEYLASLLRDLEATLKEAGHSSTIRLAAEKAEIATDKAVSVGVVVTELVTNAFKYAYPRHGGGEIRVLFRTSGEKASLTVQDDGVGWRGEGAVQGTGVGTRIVTAVARGLGSTVNYASAPVGCSVSLEFALR